MLEVSISCDMAADTPEAALEAFIELLRVRDVPLDFMIRDTGDNLEYWITAPALERKADAANALFRRLFDAAPDPCGDMFTPDYRAAWQASAAFLETKVEG